MSKKEDEKGQGTQNTGTQHSDPMKRAEQAGQAVGNTASQVANSAVSTADRAAETAGGAMRNAANTVRQNTPREGMVGAASDAVASTLDKAGEYLEKEGVSGAAQDMYGMIQRYPVTAALLGIAVGYLIGCAASSSRA